MAVPIVPVDAPRVVIEMIEAILSHRDELKVFFEGRRGLLYIDYAPGDIKLRVDKLSLGRGKGARYIG